MEKFSELFEASNGNSEIRKILKSIKIDTKEFSKSGDELHLKVKGKGKGYQRLELKYNSDDSYDLYATAYHDNAYIAFTESFSNITKYEFIEKLKKYYPKVREIDDSNNEIRRSPSGYTGGISEV